MTLYQTYMYTMTISSSKSLSFCNVFVSEKSLHTQLRYLIFADLILVAAPLQIR
jgi:hypothetical protein